MFTTALVVNSLHAKQLPISVSAARPSLVRVLEDNRSDERPFLAYQGFDGETFLQCLRQAHQDVFGKIEVTTIFDYIIWRLKSAIRREWTEDRILLRRCIRQVSVRFGDVRGVVEDLIDLWPRYVHIFDVLTYSM